MTGTEFAVLLERSGFDFFTGVPCSLIEEVIVALERRRGHPYVAAVREDAAVGIAGGVGLAGGTPVVLMQNSGLGTSLNALASFTLMYGLPVLLVVTWRGHEGTDAPEHILTGQITPSLLDLLRIPHRVLAPASAAADIAWAHHEMTTRSAPVALLLPPHVLAPPRPPQIPRAKSDAPHGQAQRSPRAEINRQEERRQPLPLSAHPRLEAAEPTPLQRIVSPPTRLAATISRLRAVRAAVKHLGDEPVIHANGYICRESFSVADRPQNFYMIGSMGLASAIGLGLALARPARTTVVFDGDGNLLMNLGALAMIGGLAPAHLVHVVFDNEVYGSTGNQRSPSRDVRLDALAAAAGYRTAVAVTDEDAIGEAMRRALAGRGPHFVLAKVTSEEAEVPRIPHTPAGIRDRFRASLGRS
ncbi:MAG: thiamine pyrophosphate-dependent enzyme [Candidatus Rokuibacteriota bacterium]